MKNRMQELKRTMLEIAECEKKLTRLKTHYQNLKTFVTEAQLQEEIKNV